MTFTDDDLKRLKELSVHTVPKGVVDYQEVTLDKEFVRAFLARLEAAERALEIRHVHGVFETAMEAWRKAAGK